MTRRTMFVGHDGVAEVDWTGTAADTDARLPGLLASFRFDKGYDYTAPEVYVVQTAKPADGTRRAVAGAIVFGGAVLFLAAAVGLFIRARRRRA